jgi:hypothetical protein
VRLYRARRALRTALLRFCTTCPTHGFLNCACEQPPTTAEEQPSWSHVMGRSQKGAKGAKSRSRARKRLPTSKMPDGSAAVVRA